MSQSSKTLTAYEQVLEVQKLQHLRVEADLTDKQTQLVSREGVETAAEHTLSETMTDWEGLLARNNFPVEWLPRLQVNISNQISELNVTKTNTQSARTQLSACQKEYYQSTAQQEKMDQTRRRLSARVRREFDDKRVEDFTEMRIGVLKSNLRRGYYDTN